MSDYIPNTILNIQVSTILSTVVILFLIAAVYIVKNEVSQYVEYRVANVLKTLLIFFMTIVFVVLCDYVFNKHSHLHSPPAWVSIISFCLILLAIFLAFFVLLVSMKRFKRHRMKQKLLAQENEFVEKFNQYTLKLQNHKLQTRQQAAVSLIELAVYCFRTFEGELNLKNMSVIMNTLCKHMQKKSKEYLKNEQDPEILDELNYIQSHLFTNQYKLGTFDGQNYIFDNPNKESRKNLNHIIFTANLINDDNVNIKHANFTAAKFFKVYWENMTFYHDTEFSGSYFDEECKLVNVTFDNTLVPVVTFPRVIEQTKFINNCNLYSAKFRYSQLYQVEYIDVTLTGAEFTGSVLEQVHFENSDLSGTKFINTQIKNCYFDNATVTYNCFLGKHYAMQHEHKEDKQGKKYEVYLFNARELYDLPTLEQYLKTIDIAKPIDECELIYHVCLDKHCTAIEITEGMGKIPDHIMAIQGKHKDNKDDGFTIFADIRTLDKLSTDIGELLR